MEPMEKVMSIIKENTEWKDKVNPDSNLIDDLGIDSFGRLMIVNSIEDEYSIEVDEEDFQELKKVKDIVRLLNEKYL